MVEAWASTGAWGHADLMFVVDADDPAAREYRAAFNTVQLPSPQGRGPARLVVAGQWRPMVPKLNLAALSTWADRYFAVGFMGDDHVPRTPGWATRYVEALRELGTGIVYGNDLIQAQRLPTQWAMTMDIVLALGRMVPAPVDHLFCDNAVYDLGKAAGCLRYLPDVVIEHRHPMVGRAPWDDGYRAVNDPARFAADKAVYEQWRAVRLDSDADAVRALMKATAWKGAPCPTSATRSRRP